MIRLSQSSLVTYLKCPKMFEYAYEKRLVKNVFNINFFVGNIIHEGLHLIYKKDTEVFSKILYIFAELLEKEREKTLISPEMEVEIEKWKVIISGMLYAYALKNSPFIDAHEHEHNELMINVKLSDDVEFHVRMDNILRNAVGSQFIHEIKTTRELNDNYVSAIKTSIQVACYYHFSRMSDVVKPSGIIYDVLQKPSIRLKQNEDIDAYLGRLEAYYHSEPDKHLWTEVIDEPSIKKDDLIQTVLSVAEGIKQGLYYKSYQACGYCDFQKPCFNNDAKEYMMPYVKKEDTEHGTITGREVNA